MNEFDRIVWGYCPRCGGRGADDPDAGNADAEATDTDGNGTRLYLYKGEYYCDVCIKEMQANEVSIRSAEKHAKQDEFLARAGFAKSI